MPDDPDRRALLVRAAQWAGVAVAAAAGMNAAVTRTAHAVPFALRPPGAKGDAAFDATCIKCGLCVEACPYATLRLAAAGDGIAVGTPHFVPRETPCYMCPGIPCAKACPTGALDAAFDDIARARMGVAVIDPEHCLSWQGLRCEICYRACPLLGKAIGVDPHPRETSKHAVFVPVVHADACTGCGLCEKACPTEVASIRVVPAAFVQGRLGAHYRMPAREDARASTPLQPAPAPSGAAPGVDYLNRGGPP